MPTEQIVSVISFAILLVIHIAEVVTNGRSRSRLEEALIRERAAAAKREAELLDRILEKEMLSRFAQGIPVPEAVLERSQPNGAAPVATTYGGPMDEGMEQYIAELRSMGRSEEWIAQQLNRMQGTR